MGTQRNISDGKIEAITVVSLTHYGSSLKFEIGFCALFLENPVIFLSIDTPQRDPKDIVSVNPEDGAPESFIRADNARGDKA
jgi:hypothetical protein